MAMKLFDLFDAENIKVEDPGLRHYITITSRLMIKSRGRRDLKKQKQT